MSEKQELNLYSYFENLKNKMYREISGARNGGFFWPSWIYSWNYAKEKVHYNNLKKRQTLDTKLDSKVKDEYNSVRKEITPRSRYVIGYRNYFSDEEMQKFNNAILKRRNYLFLGVAFLSSSLIPIHVFKLTKWWLFAPSILIVSMLYYDSKHYPEEEIGNFLNYAIEKRHSTEAYEKNKDAIKKQINNSPNLNELVESMKKNNVCLDEVMSSLYKQYLNEAKKGK